MALALASGIALALAFGFSLAFVLPWRLDCILDQRWRLDCIASWISVGVGMTVSSAFGNSIAIWDFALGLDLAFLVGGLSRSFYQCWDTATIDRFNEICSFLFVCLFVCLVGLSFAIMTFVCKNTFIAIYHDICLQELHLLQS